MSPDKKGAGGGANPSLTIPQFQKLMEFSKELLAESPVIKWAVIFAGIGGLFEIGHTIWLAIRYLAKF